MSPIRTVGNPQDAYDIGVRGLHFKGSHCLPKLSLRIGRDAAAAVRLLVRPDPKDPTWVAGRNSLLGA